MGSTIHMLPRQYMVQIEQRNQFDTNISWEYRRNNSFSPSYNKGHNQHTYTKTNNDSHEQAHYNIGKHNRPDK